MSPNAKRIASEVTAAMKEMGINVSNVLIGRFGVNMDAASEQDAKRAVEMFAKAGATVSAAEFDGEWMVSGSMN